MPDEKGGEYWGEMVVRWLKELEARMDDLEHRHHYVIEELRALIKPKASPAAAPDEEER